MAIGILLLRVAVGLTVAAHGVQKLLGWFGGHGIAGTSGFVGSLGFRPARPWAWLLALTESLGGLLLALGLLTPLAAAAVIGVMLTASVVVHAPKGFFAANGGFELPMVLGLGALAVAFTGPGAYSLDVLAGHVYHGLTWSIGALVLGVLAALVAIASSRLGVRRAQVQAS